MTIQPYEVPNEEVPLVLGIRLELADDEVFPDKDTLEDCRVVDAVVYTRQALEVLVRKRRHGIDGKRRRRVYHHSNLLKVDVLPCFDARKTNKTSSYSSLT